MQRTAPTPAKNANLRAAKGSSMSPIQCLRFAKGALAGAVMCVAGSCAAEDLATPSPSSATTHCSPRETDYFSVSVWPRHLEMSQPAREHRVHDERDDFGVVEGDCNCRTMVECHRAGRLHHRPRCSRLGASPRGNPLAPPCLSQRAASGGGATLRCDCSTAWAAASARPSGTPTGRAP